MTTRAEIDDIWYELKNLKHEIKKLKENNND